MITRVHGQRSLTGRLSGSAGLLLFLVAVVIVPLWSALSLCSMPCCHHASQPAASAASEDPCCAISRGDSSDTVAVSPVAAPQRALDAAETAPAFAVASAPNPPAAALVTHAPPPLDRSLHILNSVFLI